MAASFSNIQDPASPKFYAIYEAGGCSCEALMYLKFRTTCCNDCVFIDVMASASVGTFTSGCTGSIFFCQTGFKRISRRFVSHGKAMRGGGVKIFFVSWSFCRILKWS